MSGPRGIALEVLPMISRLVRFKEDYSASLSGERTTAYGTTLGMTRRALGGPGNPSEATPQDLQF